MMARRICIINRKGGVGKSLSTLFLGRLLARSKRRVLIADLDPQHSLSKALMKLTGKRKPPRQKTMRDLLGGGLKKTKGAIFTTEPNLDLIYGDYDLWDYAHSLPIPRLSMMLDQVDEDYDYIFLDNGPNWTNLNQSALWSCRADSDDLVLVPANPFMDDLEQAQRTLEKVQQLTKRPFRVYLNMFRDTVHQKEVLNTMEAKLKGSLIRNGIPLSQNLVGRYLDTGEEMNFEAKDKKGFAATVRELAETLLDEKITATTF